MGDGEAGHAAEVILSFWVWVSPSSRAAHYHTLAFPSAQGPHVPAVLCLVPPVYNLESQQMLTQASLLFPTV